MRAKLNKRAFNVAILARLEETYRAALQRKYRVKTLPDPYSKSLSEWAYDATQSRRWPRGRGLEKQQSILAERFRLYADVFHMAAALRDIRLLQGALDRADTRTHDVIYRLLFACGPNGDELKKLFRPDWRYVTGQRTRNRKRKTKYRRRRMPLVARVEAKRAEGLSTEDAARQVVEELDQTEWDKLTKRRERTETAIHWQARQLTKLATDGNRSDIVPEAEWSIVDREILQRHLPELAIGKFVSRVSGGPATKARRLS